jgi:vacuolar-type H+-ATPase subunit I/STV1
MGNLIWNDWARFLSITACIYSIWASYWGFFYRKFFWDFVGGTLRDPGGMQAPESASLFINIIIKAPVVQLLTMILASFLLALEWPLPILKHLPIHRSFIFRTMLLISQGVLAILFYQGTNGAIWSLIAALAYTRAMALGEEIEDAKQNKGSTGQA